MKTPKIDRVKNRLVWLPAHDLYLYQNRDQSFEKLGKALGVSHTSVSKRMKEIVGIQPRESASKPKKPKTIWDLGDHDEYYWVSGAGEVMRDLWFGGLFEVKRRDIGNAFLTKHEAEDEARARKLIAKARGSEGRKNFYSNELKWEIICIYGISQGKVTVGDCSCVSHANVFGYWETQEAAEKVLYENYEEFKWYFTEYLR